MNYITVVRGRLKGSPKDAQKAHDSTVEQLSAMTRPMGAVAHRPHLNPKDPNEFLAIDTWNNLEGLQKFMGDPKVAEAFGALFDGMPDISVWAVLILRDVLDFTAAETAEVLELTVSSVNSALHRARTTLSQRYHSAERQGSAAAETNERTQWLLDHFLAAWESADVDGLIALLKDDATFAMPPSPSWYQGADAVRIFAASTIFARDGMFGGEAAGRWRLRPTSASGAPAFIIYQRTTADQYEAFGIHVLEIDGEKLSQVTSFIDPSMPIRFGFPQRLG